jgi:hypothetical protein
MDTSPKYCTCHHWTAEGAVQVETHLPNSNRQQQICHHHPHDQAQHTPLQSQLSGHPNSQQVGFSEVHLPISAGHCHQKSEFLVAVVLNGAAKKIISFIDIPNSQNSYNI